MPQQIIDLLVCRSRSQRSLPRSQLQTESLVDRAARAPAIDRFAKLPAGVSPGERARLDLLAQSLKQMILEGAHGPTDQGGLTRRWTAEGVPTCGHSGARHARRACNALSAWIGFREFRLSKVSLAGEPEQLRCPHLLAPGKDPCSTGSLPSGRVVAEPRRDPRKITINRAWHR